VLIIILLAIFIVQPSQYETRYFNNGHGNIAYKESGSGDVVILAHGFGLDDYQWELVGLVNKLDDRYRVVTYDARGHGDSYKPTGTASYGLGMVEDIDALMKELNVSKAHIIGHSMGGMTALKFAELYPERTLSAISLGMGWLDGGEYTQKLFERPDGSAYTDALRDCYMALIELSISEDGIANLSPPFAIIIGTADKHYGETTAQLKQVRPNIGIISAEGRTHINLLWWSELGPNIVTLLGKWGYSP